MAYHVEVDDVGLDSNLDRASAAAGASARFEQPIWKSFTLSGLGRWTSWNTTLDRALGYSSKDLVDVGIAPGFRFPSLGRLRFRSQFYVYAPVGVALSYMEADAPREAIVESVDNAVGHTLGLTAGWAILLRKPLLLELELGVVYYAFDHRWRSTSRVPPEESVQQEYAYSVTWLMVSGGLSFSL
jgi:hypothetical protein